MLEKRNKDQEADYWLEMAKKQFYEDKVEWREALKSLDKSIKIRPSAEAYILKSEVFNYCGYIAFTSERQHYFTQ